MFLSYTDFHVIDEINIDTGIDISGFITGLAQFK